MKLNELKQIREALNLSQAEMGELFGVKQGVYQRWEVASNSPKAREVAEEAKEIYRKRTKKEWMPAAAPVSEREIGKLEGRIEVLERRLEQAFEQIRDLYLRGPKESR